MSTGINLAEVALHRIDESFVAMQPTLVQAVDRVKDMSGTKAELVEAIAYLTCQVRAYQKISNQDASLAIYSDW